MAQRTPVKETRVLMVSLTPDDVQRKEHIVAQLGIDEKKLTEERVKLMKRLKVTLETKTEILTALEYGQEKRELECIWVPNFETGRAQLHRPDTWHVIEERLLTDEEQQMDLFERQRVEASAVEAKEKAEKWQHPRHKEIEALRAISDALPSSRPTQANSESIPGDGVEIPLLDDGELPVNSDDDETPPEEGDQPCPFCEFPVAIDDELTLQEHSPEGNADGLICPASSLTKAAARTLKELYDGDIAQGLQPGDIDMDSLRTEALTLEAKEAALNAPHEAKTQDQLFNELLFEIGVETSYDILPRHVDQLFQRAIAIGGWGQDAADLKARLLAQCRLRAATEQLVKIWKPGEEELPPPASDSTDSAERGSENGEQSASSDEQPTKRGRGRGRKASTSAEAQA